MLSKAVSSTLARFGEPGSTSAWLCQSMGACDHDPNTWKASCHQRRKILALSPLTELQQAPWRDLGTNHHPSPFCYWGQSFSIKQRSLPLLLASADGPSVPEQVQGLKSHPINLGGQGAVQHRTGPVRDKHPSRERCRCKTREQSCTSQAFCMKPPSFV